MKEKNGSFAEFTTPELLSRALFWRYKALMRRHWIYTALVRIGSFAEQRYRALLRRYRALLRRYRALLWRYRALLQRYRALLRRYRALLRGCHSRRFFPGLSSGSTQLFCGNIELLCRNLCLFCGDVSLAGIALLTIFPRLSSG